MRENPESALLAAAGSGPGEEDTAAAPSRGPQGAGPQGSEAEAGRQSRERMTAEDTRLLRA